MGKRSGFQHLVRTVLAASLLVSCLLLPAYSSKSGIPTSIHSTEPASILLQDNFDAENGGEGALNYFNLTHWNVTFGSIDLIGNGFADFLPGNGLYLDLDGTTGAAGTIESKITFTLVPGTYRLKFSLAGSQLGDSNRVDVRLADVYTETFTPPSDAPFESIVRDIVVAAPTTGKLVFQSFGADNMGFLLDNVELLTDVTGAHLFDVTPNHGGNTGNVTVTLNGLNFPSGPVQVRLIGEGHEILADTATVTSSTRIVATFNLAAATPGIRNVELTLSDGSSLTLPGGFTIDDGGSAQLWVDVVGRDAIRLGRPQAFNITYGNRGNVDAVVEYFIVLNCPANGDLVIDRTIGAYGEPPSPPVFENSEQSVAIFVPPLHAQSSRSFTISFTSHSTNQVVITASIIAFRAAEEATASLAQSNSPLTMPRRLASTTNDETPPIGATVYLGPHAFNPFGHQAIVGRHPETNAVVVWDHFIGTAPRSLSEWRLAFGDPPYLGWATPPGWTPAIGEEAARVAAQLVAAGAIPDSLNGKNVFGGNRYSCAGLCEFAYEQAGLNPNPFGVDLFLLPGINYRRDTGKLDFYKFTADLHLKVSYLTVGLKQISDAVGGMLSVVGLAQVSATRFVQVVAAIDPNEKTGSVGLGPPRYSSGEEPLRYTIFFENVETATASAQEVIITDQLDLGLDLSTFAFGPITFGRHQLIPPPNSREFSGQIDLRPANNLIVKIDARLNNSSGLVTWKLASIDPATGLPPEDPLAGFLPPNTSPPDGQGHVFFTITPKRGLPTGTEIRNQASIIFDTNAPIQTQTWSNTLDNSAPGSQVHTLTPAPCSANLIVQWSGTDTGSGVRDYSIFVSDNGGPYTAWLSNTTATSAVFLGQLGHTYSFYSVARDHTGNTEDSAVNAEATFTIPASTPPEFTISVVPSTVKRGGKVTLNAAFRNCASAPQPVVFELSLTTPQSSTLMLSLPLTLRANQSGSFSVPLTIPKSTRVGLYTLTLDVFVGGIKSSTTTTQLTVTS